MSEKLRTFVREHLRGKCRVLSQGSACTCPLCELDSLERKLGEARECLRSFCEGLEIERIDPLLAHGKPGDFHALGSLMTKRIKSIIYKAGRWRHA